MLIWLAVTVGAGMPAAAAAAQTADPARDVEARALFDVARAAFDDGRFEDALVSFERSYQLSGRGELLFNMATCADRLRRDEDALRWFERYLDEVPEAENRRAVESRLASLHDSIAANRAREADLAAAEREAGEGGSVFETWWLWTIVGVVVIGAGVGIAVAVTTTGSTNDPVLGDVGPGGLVEALRW